MIKPIHGHTSFETAYSVPNYPYGSFRTEKRWWLENNGKKGYRLATCTLDPKSGKWNKVHYGNYSFVMGMYLDENNHVWTQGMGVYDDAAKWKNFLKLWGAHLPQEEFKTIWVTLRMAQLQSPNSFYDSKAIGDIYNGGPYIDWLNQRKAEAPDGKVPTAEKEAKVRELAKAAGVSDDLILPETFEEWKAKWVPSLAESLLNQWVLHALSANTTSRNFWK